MACPASIAYHPQTDDVGDLSSGDAAIAGLGRRVALNEGDFNHDRALSLSYTAESAYRRGSPALRPSPRQPSFRPPYRARITYALPWWRHEEPMKLTNPLDIETVVEENWRGDLGGSGAPGYWT